MIILIEYNFPDLSYLLSPKSVAFIGASIDTNTIGGRVLINLQKSHYKGKIYPVHPEYNEIFGIRTYPNLMSIPEQVDTVVIIAAARSVVPLLNECEEKKVKFIVLLTCFAEPAEDHRVLEKTLRAFSDGTGIRILGSNSYGLFNINEPFGISSSLFYEPNRLQKGRISVITVDGGLGRTVLDAADRGIGFNYWISTGNESDLEVADFIKYMAYDSSTQVIFALVEGIKDKQKFRNAAKAANRAGKPLLLFNIGNPETGVEDNQAGIISTADINELIDVGWLFVTHGIPAGNRIGIFAYSPGIKTLLANKCRLANLTVLDLTNKTKVLLQELAPEFGMASNPIHLTSSIFQNLGVFREYLEIFANDPNLDVVFVPFPYKLGTYTEMMVRQTIEVAKRMNKPIIPLWTSLSGELETSFEILIDSQLPFYRTADACILAVKHFTDYYLNRSVLMKKNIL
ncbi:CoA-binding protein [Metabacillus arenae]|uniref:CoA-binding protein n=1 Tax=Metabacillus arenae TaxID=2771434 RepID=A0A926NH52_9BACI|nr:CoA-binding protein [Metabacillus arenae]MBD1380980.1 CoA-binding protein [Metabacillus arenae]